ncbi:hypothetical protein LCGC14_0469720 [marine sediment metagenome]|uniref:M23ase beta-sheet core domain-containing protein n=1 Tax=marine sediment metagenome TaxID=412755 RepID=A0A0F9SVE8_9ZZZZ
MKKYSQGLDSEINSLVSKLMGEPTPAAGGTPLTEVTGLKYQLPVRHTKGGVGIDEENKPWIVGTYSETPFLRPVDQTVRPHFGMDLAAPSGSPVYPIGPGVVERTQQEPKGRGGRTIHLSHEEGKVTSYYSHLDKVNVSVGDKVDINTVIGGLGDSGNAKGVPHLHYEVKVGGVRVDPQAIIGKEVGSLSKRAQLIREIISKLDLFSEPDSPKSRIRKLQGIMKDEQFQIRGPRKEDS